MILLIDNYDSFTYNLMQLIGGMTQEEIKVVRNDEISIEEIVKQKPSRIFLSPGPGKPCDAGICEELIKAVAGNIPIMGVCLGHQAICEAFGGKIGYAKMLMHGKQSRIKIEKANQIFEGLPEEIPVARYHSLVAEPESLPKELVVLALDSLWGEIMAVKHRKYAVYGLQFHPESVLTPDGERIMRNFLQIQEDAA